MTITKLANKFAGQSLFEPSDHVKQDLPVPITGVMHLVGLLRSDIKAVGKLKRREQRLALMTWCLIHGLREYTALRESFSIDYLNRLKCPATSPEHAGREGLSELMMGLWWLRDDLRQTFPLDTPSSRTRYLYWFLNYHDPELPEFSQLADWQLDYLNSTTSYYAPLTPIRAMLKLQDYNLSAFSNITQDLPAPITDTMLLIWFKRSDLHTSCDLLTRRGRLKFVTWCVVFGRVEMPLLKTVLNEAYIALFRQPTLELENAKEVGISELMLGIWLLREDVQQAFPLDNQSSQQAFVHWFLSYCEYETPDLYQPAYWQKPYWDENLPRAQAKPSPAVKAVTNSSLLSKSGIQADHFEQPTLLPGVNLIGFAYGELGIGEDVRMAALAFEAAGIPFAVYNISPGIDVSQQDTSVAQHVIDALPFNTNIFCLTGFDTTRVFLEQGSALFRNRYNIGFWPWELPRWPEQWIDAYRLVDEVWASTHYTAESYRVNATVPVLRMPMVVESGTIGQYTRVDFKLPKEKILFIFSFDFNSYLARKNPEAPVKAFKMAFPNPHEAVGLVIKVMHVKPKSRPWLAFKKLIGNDPLINVIEESMRRDKVNALYKACDCFVSLHRAEGFGRGIAEAMLLGKPVIVTNFSGNLDFTHPDNAYLVAQHSIDLKKSDYPWGDGQYWAEPDIEDAASQMRLVAQHLSNLNTVPTQDLYVKTHHNRHEVGKIYKSRLQTIKRI